MSGTCSTNNNKRNTTKLKTYTQLRRNLTETPLPDAWDKNIFDTKVPFKTRVEYAKTRANQVGTGSSRIAFVIPYEGRNTVLKIAKNRKGHAQNEVEVDVLGSAWSLTDTASDLLIPMIDYDDKSSTPTWIHMEYAPYPKKTDFIRYWGESLDDVMNAIWKAKRNFGPTSGDSEIVKGIYELYESLDVEVGDFKHERNWGIYNGRIVIVDIGLNPDVWTKFYQ